MANIDGLGSGWIATSLKTAQAAERGPWLVRRLQEWTRVYIADQDAVPTNIYGHHNVSMLEDENFTNELLLHLQEIGKYVSAMDIVHYLDKPEVKTRPNLKKTVVDACDGIPMDQNTTWSIC